MIRLISRLFAASPLSDSNRRPLPYHESGSEPLTGANPLQTRVIRWTQPRATAPVRPGISLLFGTPPVLRVPMSDPVPADIRACFTDQNAAIAERLAGTRSHV
jgi:hypothetical protein